MAAPAEQWTIGRLLETASGYLREKGSTSPRLDAELLLGETLGSERIHLYTQFDRPLAAEEVDRYRALIARRAAHEPVAYIIGRAHFRHLCLEVGPAVLIPRPETEELVEAALALLRRRPPWEQPPPPGEGAAAAGGEAAATGVPALAGRPAAADAQAAPARRAATGGRSLPLIADVGTGSGAVAISLAHEAGLRVLATDTSPEALAVAARNAAALGLQASVEMLQADLLSGVPAGSLHLVVSNPPYVASGDLASLAPDIRLFEPVPALDAGPDGLAVIRRLLAEAARTLRPGGSVLLEVGDGQAAAVEALALGAGFAIVVVHRDLSGKDRIVEASLPGALSLAPGDLSEARLSMLSRALKEGAVIGLPTDTVYGLAARWDSPAGVRALYAAKGRSAEQPVAVLFASVEELERALPDLEPSAVGVMEALLPGPLTFVVATTVARAPLVGTADSLGVRVPDHAGLLEVLLSVGVPLAATSANRSGEKEGVTIADVDPLVLSYCSVAIAGPAEAPAHAEPGAEGATAPPGEPSVIGAPAGGQGAGSASTVVDLRPLSTGAAPVVLREGAVPGAQVLGRIAALDL